MPDATIKAALDAAARAECIARSKVNECTVATCDTICDWCAAGSAAAVAGFLNALPADTVGHDGDPSVRIVIQPPFWRALAAAVEEAARDA